MTPKFGDQPVAASTFFGVLITALPFISTTSPEAGGVRGVLLGAALEALRQLPELLPYNDLYLATAILARQRAGGR